MKRHLIERRTSRLVLAIGFASTTVLSLSFHGCVRGPHEITSELSGVDDSLTLGERTLGERDEQADQTADAEGPLLSSESQTDMRPIVNVGASRAASPREAFKSEGLLGTILKRRRREQDIGAALGDPFLEPTAQDAKSVAADSRGISDSQSTSMQSRATNTSETRFTKDFDARLARLREELDGLDENAAAEGGSREGSSARPFWTLTSDAATSTSSQLPAADSSPFVEAAASAARQRESLVTNTVSPPSESGADGRIGKLPRTSRDDGTGGDVADSARSSGAPVGETEPAARNVDWTESRGGDEVELAHATGVAATPREPMVSDGGVRLLAPVDDSFSAASGEPFKRIRTGTMHRELPGADATGRVAWPDEAGHADGLSILEHTVGTAPPVRDGGSGVSRASSLFSNDGIPSRFSHGDSSRMRILESRADDDWPTLAASATPPAEIESRQPVHVAGAPPLLLESETAVSPSRHLGAGRKAPERANGVRSHWATQVPWFIGGLILLLAAMRLISRKTSLNAPTT